MYAMTIALKMNIVLERVETKEQLDHINSLFSRSASDIRILLQGFLFSNPIPLEKLREFFLSQT